LFDVDLCPAIDFGQGATLSLPGWTQIFVVVIAIGFGIVTNISLSPIQFAFATGFWLWKKSSLLDILLGANSGVRLEQVRSRSELVNR